MKRLIVLGLLVVGLTACGDDDSDVESEDLEDIPSGWTVIRTPGGYGDVATSCPFPGIRLFVGKDDTYASSSVSAVVDPSCMG